jgi:hypothetical protein
MIQYSDLGKQKTNHIFNSPFLPSAAPSQLQHLSVTGYNSEAGKMMMTTKAKGLLKILLVSY